MEQMNLISIHYTLRHLFGKVHHKYVRIIIRGLYIINYAHISFFPGNCFKSCMTRIPYATMIATVMCLIGVGIFCFTMYRGASLTIIMFDQVFHFRLLWIDAVQMIFVAIGASMAALGFMILFVGCLATGSTRYKVYRAWRSRVGGRISCAVVSSVWYTCTSIEPNRHIPFVSFGSLWVSRMCWISYGHLFSVSCALSPSFTRFSGKCAHRKSKVSRGNA